LFVARLVWYTKIFALYMSKHGALHGIDTTTIGTTISLRGMCRVANKQKVAICVGRRRKDECLSGLALKPGKYLNDYAPNSSQHKAIQSKPFL
jgi:hypothetical protein